MKEVKVTVRKCQHAMMWVMDRLKSFGFGISRSRNGHQNQGPRNGHGGHAGWTLGGHRGTGRVDIWWTGCGQVVDRMSTKHSQVDRHVPDLWARWTGTIVPQTPKTFRRLRRQTIHLVCLFPLPGEVVR